MLSSLVAHADPLACGLSSGPDRIEATFSSSTLNAAATLTLNGVSVPALGPCFPIAHGQPFSGAFMRCPFGTPDNRIELYPVFANNPFGKPASLGLIRWSGDTIVLQDRATDCK